MTSFIYALAAAAWADLALAAACWGFNFLTSLLNLSLGGGARLRRPSRDRTLWLLKKRFVSCFIFLLSIAFLLLADLRGWCNICIWLREINAYRTIFPWIAQETQYWSFRYILGTAYLVKTEASEISPIIQSGYISTLNCKMCPPAPKLVSFGSAVERSWEAL